MDSEIKPRNESFDPSDTRNTERFIISRPSSKIEPGNESINTSAGSNKQIVFKCTNDQIKEHKVRFSYINAR